MLWTQHDAVTVIAEFPKPCKFIRFDRSKFGPEDYFPDAEYAIIDGDGDIILAWNGTPATYPSYTTTWDDYAKLAHDDPQIKQEAIFHEWSAQIEEKLVLPVEQGHWFYTVCYNSGFDQDDGHTTIEPWLAHNLAELLEQHELDNGQVSS